MQFRDALSRPVRVILRTLLTRSRARVRFYLSTQSLDFGSSKFIFMSDFTASTHRCLPLSGVRVLYVRRSQISPIWYQLTVTHTQTHILQSNRVEYNNKSIETFFPIQIRVCVVQERTTLRERERARGKFKIHVPEEIKR